MLHVFLVKLVLGLAFQNTLHLLLFYDEEINTVYVEIRFTLAKINGLKVQTKRVACFSLWPPGLMDIKNRLYKQTLGFHNSRKALPWKRTSGEAFALRGAMVSIKLAFYKHTHIHTHLKILNYN